MNIQYVLGAIIAITLITIVATIPVLLLQQQAAYARIQIAATRGEAPVAITGDNVYVAWWTNNTANSNNEVMFRASTNGGVSFGEKINLSNTTDADSTRAEIDSDADSVVVTWWETNQTSDTPVMKVSSDNGATFGPTLTLATNGTIGEGEEAE